MIMNINTQRIHTSNDIISHIETSKQPVPTYNPDDGADMTTEQLKSRIETSNKQTQILIYLKCKQHCEQTVNDIGDGSAFTLNLTKCPPKILREIKTLVGTGQALTQAATHS